MKNQTVELTRRIHDPREIYFQLKEIRKNLCQHAGIYLKEFQERASDEIFWKYSLGGNQEVVMLWARRSGKTECLVITGLCICLFEIHVNRPVMQGISKQFLWGLVNPSRTEQGVMVTRQRIKDRVESIEKWLLTDWGIHSELGDGRKTPDFVLRSDALNSEAQIRAISGHPTASEKGAGFQLMFIEQVENLDEQTMKTVIFPMAAGSELTLTKVLAGTPDLVIENEYF
ncbi:MAG TPA: hypothetical protein VE862_10050, partial [Candidatus Acidoferrum sp.]|nr:hypothetical protein [Candidatus Acidoferrum sp.]